MKLHLALLLTLLFVGCGAGGVGLPSDQPEAPPPPPGQTYGTATDHILVQPAVGVPLPLLLAELGTVSQGVVEGTSFLRLSVPAGQTPEGFVAQCEASVRVLAAELDLGLSGPEGHGRTLPAGGTLLSVNLPQQPDLLRIGIQAAQTRALGTGVLVAVIDSGAVMNHSFLAGRLAGTGRDYVDDDMDASERRNGLDDDQDGFVDEGWGHGTFVSSLVLAVAPEAQVLPLRVLGSDLFGTSSAVASAIVYAANAGAEVIHLSVSVPPEVQVVRQAIDNARLLGSVVIGSAGNSGEEDVSAAQAASGAFLVTALDEDDVWPDFASFGEGVALAAPGVEVHGAYPTQNPDTARWSGTSFSAPMVSGAFALLRDLFPLVPADDLLLRLQQTAVPVDALNPGLEGKLGAGRLDLDAATAP